LFDYFAAAQCRRHVFQPNVPLEQPGKNVARPAQRPLAAKSDNPLNGHGVMIA
jgi:hypothetical protein